jgi:fluoride exporter
VREALAVMAGGALGSVARWGIGVWIASLPLTTRFPVATLTVNIAGSFAIGFLSEISLTAGQRLADPGWKAFLIVGLLGGFTTFSAFSHQTITLLRDGHPVHALWNVFLSVALCLLAVWAGLAAAHRFHPAQP